MAESTNFFTSDSFSAATSSLTSIATGFLANANAKTQAEYATELQRLKNDASLTESERQQKIALLNAQYQALIQAGQDNARADYLKWGILAGGVGLTALALWLLFGRKGRK